MSYTLNFLHFHLDLVFEFGNPLSIIVFNQLKLLLLKEFTIINILLQVLLKVLLVAKHRFVPLNVPLVELLVRHFSEVVDQFGLFLQLEEASVHLMEHLFLLVLIELN
jgi:hypothetical protein